MKIEKFLVKILFFNALDTIIPHFFLESSVFACFCSLGSRKLPTGLIRF